MLLGSEIAHSGDYTSKKGAGFSLGPTAYFPPAYPYFVAAVDLLDGHEAGGPTSVLPTRFSQIALGMLTVALIGLVALEAFGSTVALIALGIAAVYPVLVEMSGILVAENLLLVFELGAVYAALRARRARRRFAWVIAAGVLTGLAALTHENALLMVPPMIVAVWSTRPRWSPRALAAPAVLVASTALTIAPWTIRNAVVMHRFIPIADETGITLVGTYNPTSAAAQPVPYKWRLYNKIVGERPIVKAAHHMSESALSNRLQRQAFHYIADHPFSPLVVAYHNTLRMLELEGSFAWHASAYAQGLRPTTAIWGVIGFWVICTLALLGAFTRLARRAPGWMWAVPLLFALSAVLVNVETPRFRAPVDPFLILLAACAIATAGARVLGRSAVAGDDRAPLAGRERQLVEVIKRLA
jgi:4-amino-4-deoxy-L-arabinose transferase-like glycosyltransferase